MEDDKMNETIIKPEKTAMARNEATPYARAMVESYRNAIKFESVLDFGCGKSIDAEFYRENGIDAVGYDRAPEFGCTAKPERKFDLVTMIFVLNILPSREKRLKAISQAKQYLDDGSKLFIVTRRDKKINKIARESGWERHNDGYISKKYKDGSATFQKGLSKEEIIDLAKEKGLSLHPKDSKIKINYYTSYALFKKSD